MRTRNLLTAALAALFVTLLGCDSGGDSSSGSSEGSVECPTDVSCDTFASCFCERQGPLVAQCALLMTYREEVCGGPVPDEEMESCVRHPGDYPVTVEDCEERVCFITLLASTDDRSLCE